MTRIILAAAALAIGLGFTGIAQAGDHAKGGHAKLVFPMKGDEFSKHMDTKLAKMRERLERRITEKQIAANDAKELRAKFDAGAAKVVAITKQVAADGVVTEDEAKQVRATAKEMKPHRGKKKA